jgi:hypothetical protein
VKDFVRTIRTSIKPLYAIPVAVVVVLIVAGVLLFGGGGKDDVASDAPKPSLGFAEGDPSSLPGARSRPVKRAPTVRSGVLDEARREGRLAVAQARGTVLAPTRVRVRVSAAPKQKVTVNWQLGCFKGRRATVGRGQYRVVAPDVHVLDLPVSGAKSCIATASGQLTRNEGAGRIKVAIVAGG